MHFLTFLIGMITGGIIMTIVMCCFQINRYDDYSK